MKKGTELFTQYEVSMDKEGMKHVLKAALEIGHRYTGKSRKEFAKEVRPYLEMASNLLQPGCTYVWYEVDVVKEIVMIERLEKL